MIAELIEMFSYPFMRHSLLVGVFGGGLLAFLGIFVHLRRIVFLGAALPQIIAMGIAAAVFVSVPPIIGAFVGGGLGILLLSRVRSDSHISNDGWIGIAFAAGASVAIVLIAVSPVPDGHALRIFEGKDILGTSFGDALAAMIAAGSVALIFALFWSRLVITGFDSTMSSTLGIRVNFWNGLFFLCLGAALAVVMNTAGSMLAFSMLVGPSAAALLLFRNFPCIVITAVVLGVVSAVTGLTASYFLEIYHDISLPGGPAMATAALSTVIFAWPVSAYMRTRAVKKQKSDAAA
ncbi:metal ABC transporter permease [Chitinivibrio alkaliphilus]|uniref:Mn2+/Zn2+ ABC transporter permease component n=1 Tax=Chitinivibrio alkaliphilus ACht1 TaxID=1313304 RepID=U7DC19_9BACT|nr:metal ABC transporter permease [Chitinivibrio alkaliphilus]ERP31960.1 Mn2+/Zn2+ ABC transporter permease component [Chitinivibrio alkaliphilus ACht1]